MKAWTLAGKRALITGGSKGIGLAAVDEFLALGAQVLIVARGEAELTSVVAERAEADRPAGFKVLGFDEGGRDIISGGRGLGQHGCQEVGRGSAAA